jgi:hypothetical protein
VLGEHRADDRLTAVRSLRRRRLAGPEDPDRAERTLARRQSRRWSPVFSHSGSINPALAAEMRSGGTSGLADGISSGPDAATNRDRVVTAITQASARWKGMRSRLPSRPLSSPNSSRSGPIFPSSRLR